MGNIKTTKKQLRRIIREELLRTGAYKVIAEKRGALRRAAKWLTKSEEEMGSEQASKYSDEDKKKAKQVAAAVKRKTGETEPAGAGADMPSVLGLKPDQVERYLKIYKAIN